MIGGTLMKIRTMMKINMSLLTAFVIALPFGTGAGGWLLFFMPLERTTHECHHIKVLHGKNLSCLLQLCKSHKSPDLPFAVVGGAVLCIIEENIPLI